MHKPITCLLTLTLLPAIHFQSTTLLAQDTSTDAHTGTISKISPSVPSRRQMIDSQPIAGLWLRTDSGSVLRTVTSDQKKAEFRLDRGRLNISIHQPANHAEALVDLPGGQITLTKDGFYTFNADTGTVRVLRGGAAAYPGTRNANTKAIKIGAHHQLALVPAANGVKSVDAYPYELYADLLPLGSGNPGYQTLGNQQFATYGYPYYAAEWGYPWDWGYLYPYSYGVGVGYYGFSGGPAARVRR